MERRPSSFHHRNTCELCLRGNYSWFHDHASRTIPACRPISLILHAVTAANRGLAGLINLRVASHDPQPEQRYETTHSRQIHVLLNSNCFQRAKEINSASGPSVPAQANICQSSNTGSSVWKLPRSTTSPSEPSACNLQHSANSASHTTSPPAASAPAPLIL